MQYIKKHLQKIASVFQVTPKRDFLFVVAGIILGTWFNWDIMEILFFALLILAVLRSFPSRIMILPSILFLCLTIILLGLDRNAQAEEFSVYAYYLLGISIILALIESWQEKSE